MLVGEERAAGRLLTVLPVGNNGVKAGSGLHNV